MDPLKTLFYFVRPLFRLKKLNTELAEEVRAHLVSQGIPPAKITAVGRGEAVPVADNNSAEGRANNRRVELVVTPE